MLEDLSLAYCRVPPPHGGVEKCLATAQKLIDLQPNNPRSYEAMGERLRSPSVNRWEDAVRQFKKAEALDDDFTSLWYAAGLMAHGYAEQAVIKLRKYQIMSPLDAGMLLAPALLATNRAAEARELEEFHSFVLGEPAYADPWGIPLSYVFENNYPAAVHALRNYYDLLGDSGVKNQTPTGHVMLSRILRELGDRQAAELWLARAGSRFGSTNSVVLNEHFTIAIIELDVAAVEKGAQAFLKHYGVDAFKWVAITQARRDGDTETLSKMSMDNAQRSSIPFNTVSTTLISVGVVGSQELTAEVLSKVRSFYAEGGGTWGAAGNPDPFTIPGEREKQFNFALMALLESNWPQAMSHFERGFQVGLRSLWRLPYFSLVKDKNEIYGDFVGSSEWNSYVEKVRDANQRDLEKIRTQFPELFSER